MLGFFSERNRCCSFRLLQETAHIKFSDATHIAYVFLKLCYSKNWTIYGPFSALEGSVEYLRGVSSLGHSKCQTKAKQTEHKQSKNSLIGNSISTVIVRWTPVIRKRTSIVWWTKQWNSRSRRWRWSLEVNNSSTIGWDGILAVWHGWIAKKCVGVVRERPAIQRFVPELGMHCIKQRSWKIRHNIP